MASTRLIGKINFILVIMYVSGEKKKKKKKHEAHFSFHFGNLVSTTFFASEAMLRPMYVGFRP